MIKNFTDHAANERTFLAWVRTAIAVMAFGFLVEKFDLFLEMMAPSMAGAHMLKVPGQRFSTIAGLTLVVLGIIMIGVSVIRFRMTAKAIDAAELHVGVGSRIDMALAALLVLLSFVLLVYLSEAVASQL